MASKRYRKLRRWMLQRGRRFSATEISRISRSVPSAISWLQRGRRFSATEIRSGRARGEGGHRASTGPSLLSDGNRKIGLFRGFLAQASTGPSLLSDGNRGSRREHVRCDQASTGPSLLSDGNAASA